MKEYKTEQREILLSFLREHLHEQLSVDEISSHLCTEDGISRSSVYRNIERLVVEGAVQRLATGKGRGFLYQYTGNAECSRHLHLKCVDCGQVFHMNDEATHRVTEAIKRDAGFRVDGQRSVLYGVCRPCEDKRKRLPLSRRGRTE